MIESHSWATHGITIPIFFSGTFSYFSWHKTDLRSNQCNLIQAAIMINLLVLSVSLLIQKGYLESEGKWWLRRAPIRDPTSPSSPPSTVTASKPMTVVSCFGAHFLCWVYNGCRCSLQPTNNWALPPPHLLPAPLPPHSATMRFCCSQPILSWFYSPLASGIFYSPQKLTELANVSTFFHSHMPRYLKPLFWDSPHPQLLL